MPFFEIGIVACYESSPSYLQSVPSLFDGWKSKYKDDFASPSYLCFFCARTFPPFTPHHSPTLQSSSHIRYRLWEWEAFTPWGFSPSLFAFSFIFIFVNISDIFSMQSSKPSFPSYMIFAPYFWSLNSIFLFFLFKKFSTGFTCCWDPMRKMRRTTSRIAPLRKRRVAAILEIITLPRQSARNQSLHFLAS